MDTEGHRARAGAPTAGAAAGRVHGGNGRATWNPLSLTYVKSDIYGKTQVYLRKEELDALRKAAARSGRSVAELVRDAIRKVVLKPQAAGPVAIWDGDPKRTSVDHDSVHDEP
jgi:hypothetical protein